MKQRRGGFAALVLLAVLVLCGASAGGYFAARELDLNHTSGSGSRSPVPTSSALDAATVAPSPPRSAAAAPMPSAAALSRTLAPKLAAAALGGHVLALVADAASGAVFDDHLGAVPAAPASTAKLLTATALIAARGPAYRITTTVVAGATPGTIVLVGAGDPTLTGAAGTAPGAYPDAARIGVLAAQLRAARVNVSRVVVDDTLFTGPPVSPAWAPQDVPSDYAAPITAVMADGGRAAAEDASRTASPDLAAGRELAAGLDLPASRVARGTAPSGTATLASVTSPPMAELVEQMLAQSDNVIAECLARQVALAKGMPASFTGAAAAVRAVLAGLGADPGAGMYDGSGLAATDRITPAELVAVLRLVVGDAQPALHDIVTALPVAAWSGTLSDRYLSGSTAAAGAGVVRAKTGTLTSVSSLAGVVHDTAGRLLVFALIADQLPPDASSTAAAETALDQVVATLATCGCS